MNYKNIIVIVIGLVLGIEGFSQNKYTKLADRYFKQNSFGKADTEYKKAESKVKSNKDRGYVNYHRGVCNLKTFKYKDAENFLQKSVNFQYANENPDVLYQLAVAQKNNGKYSEAINTFKKYLKFKPDDKVAKQEVENADKLRSLLRDKTRHIITPVSALNTDQFDFSTTFADKKNNQLIYSTGRSGTTGNKVSIMNNSYLDLWMTTRDQKGNWLAPERLPESINTPNHEATPIMNTKRTRMYYTRCYSTQIVKKESHGCEIWYADKQGKNWKPSIKLDLADDSTISVMHPALNRQENILVFASDMPGGQGGRDLWYIEYDKKTKAWGDPVNLGPEINTKEDELFPYVHQDGNLYFSSKGHLGIGGLDLFVATPKNKTWTKPKNLGSPLNSPQDDFGINFEKGSTSEGILSSNRGGKGSDDLFSFYLPKFNYTLTVEVKDFDTKEPISSTDIALKGSNGSIVNVKTGADGKYLFAEKSNKTRYILKENDYSIKASHDGYFAKTEKISTRNLEESKNFYVEIFIKKPEENIVMPEVQYKLGTAEFVVNDQINSKDSLLFLYNVLVENPTIVAELRAHTDCRDTDERNLALSQRRAQACVDFLVSKGIPKERLVAKGYGESVPRVITENGEKVTLRCNMITRLKNKDKEKFERYHQLNRRTEFSVLSFDYKPKEN